MSNDGLINVEDPKDVPPPVADLPDDARTDRLLEMAEFLESDAAVGHFYMGSFYTGKSWRVSPTGATELLPFDELIHTCGAAMCFAGLAEAMFTPNHMRAFSLIENNAQGALGLDTHATNALFYPTGYTKQGVSYYHVANPLAGAAVLRHCIATRRVDWRVAEDLIDKTHDHPV
jgi:hypothetical protein